MLYPQCCSIKIGTRHTFCIIWSADQFSVLQEGGNSYKWRCGRPVKNHTCCVQCDLNRHGWLWLSSTWIWTLPPLLKNIRDQCNCSLKRFLIGWCGGLVKWKGTVYLIMHLFLISVSVLTLWGIIQDAAAVVLSHNDSSSLLTFCPEHVHMYSQVLNLKNLTFKLQNSACRRQ